MNRPVTSAALALFDDPELHADDCTALVWANDDSSLTDTDCNCALASLSKIEAEARSLSDSEPPLGFINQYGRAECAACRSSTLPENWSNHLAGVTHQRNAKVWYARQPQPALPSEPPDPRGDKPPRRFPCPLCPEWFWSREDMARHRNGIHTAEPERERAGDPLDVERLRRAMASDEEMFRLLWPDENGLDLAAERIAAEYARLSSQSPVASEESPT